MKAGERETRQQLTARVTILPEGATGIGDIDLGDLSGHKILIEREGAEQFISDSGKQRRIGNATSVVGAGWEFMLRESFDFGAALGLMGTRGSDTVGWPAGGAGALTAQIVGAKQGYTYFLGLNHFYNEAVEVGGNPKVAGVDYVFDGACGTLRILKGGGIADGATVDFEAAGYGRGEEETYDALSKANAQFGVATIYELDQHDGFRSRSAANVQYWIEGGAEHDGKKPAERKLVVMLRERPNLVVKTLK